MSKQAQRFTFRVDTVTLEKLRYIADNNFRTINKELDMLVTRYIAEYEQHNGLITAKNAAREAMVNNA